MQCVPMRGLLNISRLVDIGKGITLMVPGQGKFTSKFNLPNSTNLASIYIRQQAEVSMAVGRRVAGFSR